MNKNIFIGVFVVTTLIFAGLYFSVTNELGAGIGQNHYQAENFIQGLTLGNGTIIKKSNCGTATWNPASLVTSTSAGIDITVTGATIASNQVYFVGLGTSTLGMTLSGNASGTAGIITAVLVNNSGATRDLGTSTAKACFLQF